MTSLEIKKILGLVCTCQSAIHQVDDIINESIPVREFKRETNRYLKSLEKFVEPVNKGMCLDESDYYNKIVSKIDEIVGSIEVETEINN